MAKYTPKTRDELKKLVQDENIYLGDIDTSNITDMSNLFRGSTRKDFSGIESWDISNVVTMNNMFYNAKSFNHNINSWDTSKVVDMSSMFSLADNFNQPLNKWDTSSVVSMFSMFFRSKSFNQPLDNWDTSSVEFMTRMFERAESFNQNLNLWNVSSVRDNQQMFWDSGMNKLPKWHKKRAIVDLPINDIIEWGDRAQKIINISNNRVAEAIANPRPKKPKIAPQDKPQSNIANDWGKFFEGSSKPVLTKKSIFRVIGATLFFVIVAVVAINFDDMRRSIKRSNSKATTQTTQQKQTQPAQQPAQNILQCNDRDLLKHLIKTIKEIVKYDIASQPQYWEDIQLRGKKAGLNFTSVDAFVESVKFNIMYVNTKLHDESNQKITCEVRIVRISPIDPNKQVHFFVDYSAWVSNDGIQFEFLGSRSVAK